MNHIVYMATLWSTQWEGFGGGAKTARCPTLQEGLRLLPTVQPAGIFCGKKIYSVKPQGREWLPVCQSSRWLWYARGQQEVQQDGAHGDMNSLHSSVPWENPPCRSKELCFVGCCHMHQHSERCHRGHATQMLPKDFLIVHKIPHKNAEPGDLYDH